MFIVLILYTVIMCLHPVLDRKLTTLYNKYENASLEEFDTCDYVHKITDVVPSDLVVIQLNIRGIGSKRSQILDLIENSVQWKQPDVLLLSETWLTPFSPKLVVPGYELYHQDRLSKKGGSSDPSSKQPTVLYKNQPVLSTH